MLLSLSYLTLIFTANTYCYWHQLDRWFWILIHVMDPMEYPGDFDQTLHQSPHHGKGSRHCTWVAVKGGLGCCWLSGPSVERTVPDPRICQPLVASVQANWAAGRSCFQWLYYALKIDSIFVPPSLPFYFCNILWAIEGVVQMFCLGQSTQVLLIFSLKHPWVSVFAAIHCLWLRLNVALVSGYVQ